MPLLNARALPPTAEETGVDAASVRKFSSFGLLAAEPVEGEPLLVETLPPGEGTASLSQPKGSERGEEMDG